MKEISFIIPIYNCESYIERCVSSIMASLQDDLQSQIEIIFINDGSTDNSEYICRKLIDSYSDVFLVSQPNRGASAARNAGINIARGKYIWFVDADDRVAPGALENLISYLKHKSPEVVTFNYESEQTNGSTLNISFAHETVVLGRDYLSQNSALYLWNKIFRRDVCGNIRFLEGTKNIEDFLFNIEVLIDLGMIVQLPIIGYIYNTTNQQSTSRDKSLRNLIKLTHDSFAVHSRLLSVISQLNGENRIVVKSLLYHSVAGHFYSLIRFYNRKRICHAIDWYSKKSLYPLPYSGNFKQKLYTFFINRQTIFKISSRKT